MNPQPISNRSTTNQNDCVGRHVPSFRYLLQADASSIVSMIIDKTNNVGQRRTSGGAGIRQFHWVNRKSLADVGRAIDDQDRYSPDIACGALSLLVIDPCFKVALQHLADGVAGEWLCVNSNRSGFYIGRVWVLECAQFVGVGR